MVIRREGAALGSAGPGAVTVVARRDVDARDEIGADAQVIGTGGLVQVISTQAPVFDAINQDLTLIGLRLIYEMNQKKKT